MAKTYYKIIFPTKEFISKRCTAKDIEEAIVFKKDGWKLVVVDEGKKKGRLYYGLNRQLDFEIKKIRS